MKKILLITLLITLAGCKVKHKVISKEKTRTQLEQSTEIVEKENTIKTVDSSAIIKSTTVVIKENEFIDVLSDSTGIVTVNEQITPEGKKITFTGVKSVHIGRNKESTEDDNESTVNLNKTEEVEKNKTENIDTELSAETSTRDTDSKVMGMNSFVAGGIGLGLLAIIVLWYIKRKKRRLVG